MNAIPTKSAVRKAGSGIRRFARGEIDTIQFSQCIDVLVAYRAQFATPLEEFQTQLLELQEHAGIQVETTQRLKRIPTILDKLVREPGLDLSRMQDIGGCRCVLQTLDELYALRALVREKWVCTESDYVSQPRESGYRAIHLVVDFNNVKIELQLRTLVMHQWAQTVEAFSGVLGENLKQDGTHFVQQFMYELAEISYIDPGDILAKREASDRIEALRPRVTEAIQSAIKQSEKEQDEHPE